MDVMVVVVLLVAAVALVSPAVQGWSVPTPVVLTLVGILVALAPFTPDALVPPEYVLPLLLPPLLFAAAQRASLRDFAQNAVALVALAVVLVVVTIASVALVAVAVDPALPIAAAVVLGAVVSPPDPVAATSVASRLRLPKPIVDVLEGEGLLNDAIALVVYTVAVSTLVPDLRAGEGVTVLALSVVVAPLVGLALAWLAVRQLDRIEDARAEVAVTVVLPYAAFLIMEQLGGSGVLAVVVAGVYIGQHSPAALSSYGFLAGTTVWAFADWVVSGLAFALIGYELAEVLREPGVVTGGLGVAAATCVTVIVVRALYVLPLDWVGRHSRRGRRRRRSHSWRDATVIAWAGMRGVVTLATTLALPEQMPGRDVVVLSAIAVVLVTLVGQGVTLPWIVRRLGVAGEPVEETAEAELRRRTSEAALRRLDELEEQGLVDAEVVHVLRRAYERRVAGGLAAAPDDERRRLAQIRVAARELRATERETVQRLRRSGGTTVAAANAELHDIESREALDTARAQREEGSAGAG